MENPDKYSPTFRLYFPEEGYYISNGFFKLKVSSRLHGKYLCDFLNDLFTEFTKDGII